MSRDPMPEGDDLSDLLSSPLRTTPVVPPASYQPKGFTEKCFKCGGTGRWRGRGQCFGCNGTGTVTHVTSPETRAKKRAQVASSKVRKTEGALDAFKAVEPEVWAWMDGNDFPFAVAMLTALQKWGSLTDNQLIACKRAIDSRAKAQAAATARVADAKTIDMSKIEAAFAKAGASLKKPILRVAGFTIYPAKADSRNAGSLYVRGLAADKSEDIYLGKITGTKFIRSRDCTPEQEAKMVEIADDPKGAAIAYGRLTGSCACCGRQLFDPDSVAAGIGPICASRFGW